MLPPSRRHQRRLCHPALRPPFFVMANYSALTDNMRNLLASCIYLMLEMRGADDARGAGRVRRKSARHLLPVAAPAARGGPGSGESVTLVYSIPPEEFTPPRAGASGKSAPFRQDAAAQAAVRQALGPCRSDDPEFSDLRKRIPPARARQPPPPVPTVPAPAPPQFPPSLPAAAAVVPP